MMELKQNNVVKDHEDGLMVWGQHYPVTLELLAKDH